MINCNAKLVASDIPAFEIAFKLKQLNSKNDIESEKIIEDTQNSTESQARNSTESHSQKIIEDPQNRSVPKSRDSSLSDTKRAIFKWQ